MHEKQKLRYVQVTSKYVWLTNILQVIRRENLDGKIEGSCYGVQDDVGSAGEVG